MQDPLWPQMPPLTLWTPPPILTLDITWSHDGFVLLPDTIGVGARPWRSILGQTPVYPAAWLPGISQCTRKSRVGCLMGDATSHRSTRAQYVSWEKLNSYIFVSKPTKCCTFALASSGFTEFFCRCFLPAEYIPFLLVASTLLTSQGGGHTDAQFCSALLLRDSFTVTNCSPSLWWSSHLTIRNSINWSATRK